MTAAPSHHQAPVLRHPAGGLRQAHGLFSLMLMMVVALLCAAIRQPAQAGTVPGELPAFVGSLSTVQGDVRWYDRDSAGWLGTPQQPLRNWPLAAGDRLRTGADGRAELRLGSTTLRLGADADLTLQRLDEQGLVLFLQSGTVALRLADGPAGDAIRTELLTPEGRWLPQQPGHYRFDRQADGRQPPSVPATQATSWRGELRFEGRDSALNIPAGRRADLWLDRATGVTRYAWAPVDRDAFADWVARDERLDDAPATARRVPPGMTGWQDLDRHGDWVSHPEMGEVWQPRQVALGWAPFQQGRWAWVAPWGWTWIDAAPWGFAPFHYGSWVVWQGRWCWSPGARQARPRYAPALSAWIAPPALPAPGVVIRIGGRPPPPRVVVPVVIVLPGSGGHDHHDRPSRPGPPDRADGRDAPRHDRRDERHDDRRDAPRLDRHDDRRDDRREDRRDDRREDRRDDRREARPVLPIPAQAPGPALPGQPARPLTQAPPALPTAPAVAVQPAVPPRPVVPPSARPADPPSAHAPPPLRAPAPAPAAAPVAAPPPPPAPAPAPAPAARPTREAEPRRDGREPRDKTEERRLQDPARADPLPGQQRQERQERQERQDRPERGNAR